MLSVNSELLKIVNPNQKDIKWMDNYVSYLRRDMRHWIEPNVYFENRAIILSEQAMDKIKKTFKDKDFIKETDFEPLGVVNRIFNIMVEELIKNPPKIEVVANDAMAENEVKEDILLLRYKTKHEQMINYFNKKVGQPATYKVDDDKFKTNIEEFYRMGLDPTDEEDINFYEQNDFPRLKWAIAAQKALNAIIKINKFDEDIIRDIAMDIFCSLFVGTQTYVDQITGEIKCECIRAYEAMGIWGNKRDGTEDTCQAWEKNVTVGEFLARVGNKFDFNKHWYYLLWSINYMNNTQYTGFVSNGVERDCMNDNDLIERGGMRGWKRNVLDYSLAYTYQVYLGYVEFDTAEVTASYLKKNGEVLPKMVTGDYLDQNPEMKKEYEVENFYQNQVYKSYYLPSSTTSQWLFNWGKLYYQELYGANDEYARGSLTYYRLDGKPPAELIKPYVGFANLCFYRMKWVVYHSKPHKEQYIMEELVKLAKVMQRQFAQNGNTDNSKLPVLSNIITDIIKYKNENFVDIRTFPEVEGQTQKMLPQQEATKGGIDSLATGLQAIETWLENQISDKIGLNDVRMGNIQNARQGYKAGEAETQSSYNATGYIYRMVQYVKENTATSMLNKVQDIVRFKDTVPYKYLLKLLGENEFENLKLLKEFAAHRYGILVENYSAQLERQYFLQMVNRSIDTGDGRGGLSVIEGGLLMMENDYKAGLKKLQYFKYKADKKKRKQEIENMKMQQENAMQLKKADDDIQKHKIDGEMGVKKIEADAQKYAADKQKEAKIETKEMSNQHEPIKQDVKAQSQEKVIAAKAQAEAQQPLV